MTSVSPEKLLSGYDQIKRGYQALSALVDEFPSVSKRGGYSPKLSQINEQLYQTFLKYQILMRGLETVIQIYSACEDRVSNICENSLVKYPQPSLAYEDLSDMIDFLKEFTIS